MVKGGGRKPNHHRSKKGAECADDLGGEKEEAGEGSDEPEEPEGDEIKKKVAKAPILAKDDELDAELAKQFGDDGGLTRKQREELEKQEQERSAEKARAKGETDEAKADLERLAEARARREEQKKQREQAAAEAEKTVAADAAKDESVEKQRNVALKILELVLAAKDGTLTLNHLNQDANCKKLLKPLCKKEGVKALNRAWLEKYPELFKLKVEDGGNVHITAKQK
eukprot:gnl/TRDRNA2_/TRDRNA2_201135_c0_seq1.p1 gnl/TRDRNA2_/TRDRNA2_201135_c0~~gnl/TRDRNA2_/TRDRNA2_201135_c0_seq1.p1  ORF type:complete len:235 (-),score=83.07 gnl/TRDRNA2_/TRDRNA2_201135_c0_seq1:202-879(-)